MQVRGIVSNILSVSTTGDQSITGEKTFSDIVVTQALNSYGPTMIQDSFKVHGNGADRFAVEQNTGNTTIAGTLAVTGNASSAQLTCTSLDVNGAGDVSSTLNVGGQLTVNGEVEATSLDINGAADISSTLNVGAKLTVAGEVEATNLDINGNGTVSGTLAVVGKLSSTGEVEGGSLDINGNGDIYTLDAANYLMSDRVFIHDSSNTHNWEFFSSSSNNLGLFYNGVNRGYFAHDFSAARFDFTGTHRCAVDPSTVEAHEGAVGKVLCIPSTFAGSEGVISSLPGGCLAKGRKAITISEATPTLEICTHKACKAVFGVSAGVKTSVDEVNLGLVGVNYPVWPGSPHVISNSLGEGACWVIDMGESLNVGDLLMSSGIDGYLCKQDDDIFRSCTVAKISMNCNFTPLASDWSRQEALFAVKNGDEATVTIDGVETVCARQVKTREHVDWRPEENFLIGTKTSPDDTLCIYAAKLDASGHLIWEQEDGPAYETRSVSTPSDGVKTAAFVPCTYHCG